MKKMNVNVTRLNNAFAALDNAGITSLDQLKQPENETLFAGLWLAMEGFVKNRALCSTVHTDRQGNMKLGNAGKLEILAQNGYDPELVADDILFHIMRKLDLVLKQSADIRTKYVFVIVNNQVDSVMRKFQRRQAQNIQEIRLEAIRQNGQGDSYTAEEQVADPRVNLEEALEQKETLAEKFSERTARAVNAGKHLGKRPAQLLTYLACNELHMKPRKLTEALFRHGAAQLGVIILNQLNVQDEEMKQILANEDQLTEEFKLNTDAKTVAAEISRLSYRAEKTMTKHQAA